MGDTLKKHAEETLRQRLKIGIVANLTRVEQSMVEAATISDSLLFGAACAIVDDLESAARKLQKEAQSLAGLASRYFEATSTMRKETT